AGGSDGLALDQRDGALAVVVGACVLAFASGVTVAVEADPGGRLDVVARFHRRALVGRRVDGDDLPSEHARQSRVLVGAAFGCLSPSHGQTDLEPLAPARAGATAGRVRAERAR